jgi:hypothetical protein
MDFTALLLSSEFAVNPQLALLGAQSTAVKIER